MNLARVRRMVFVSFSAPRNTCARAVAFGSQETETTYETLNSWTVEPERSKARPAIASEKFCGRRAAQIAGKKFCC